MSFFEYLQEYQSDYVVRTQQHVFLALIVIVLSGALGVALSMAVYRSSWASNAVVSAASVIFTLPSFAVFTLMMSAVGRNLAAALPVLIGYALLPIVRNGVVGLRGVDAAMLDAAQGMGMDRSKILFRIELPLAWPVILAGLRVSAMLTIGLIAMGAFVVDSGLGTFIFHALSNLGSVNTDHEAIAATALVAIIALIFDAVLLLVRRFTTPRGLRV